MNTGMRYGVQFQPLSTTIEAGAVRRDQKLERDVFVTRSDATDQAIGAVVLWVLAHFGNGPCPITDRNGTTYELTVRIT